MRNQLAWVLLLAVGGGIAPVQAQSESSGAGAEAEAAQVEESSPWAEVEAAPAAEPAVATEPEGEAGTIPVNAGTEPVPAAATSTELDEIVVTANRRQTRIDAVPVAVYEISGAQLEDNVIRDTQSLVMQAPSLNIQFSGSEANATIRIRGIGTGGSNAGFESSVGVFVDGVYLPRPGLALNDLVDIERVEVLRGPQGTLFGKNTTVGAIHLLTRAPRFEPEASLTAGLGNFGSRSVTAIANGPAIGDWLAFRVAGQYNKRDGYVENVFDGSRFNDRNRYLVRGQALILPTDDLSIRLVGSRVNKDERCCVAPWTAYNPDTATNIEEHGGTVFENPPAEYKVAFDYTDTFSKAGEDSYAAHVDWYLGGITAKGVFSHATSFADDKRDGDFTDVDFAYQPFVNLQTRLNTAELSFQGTFGFVDWVAGGFYSKEKIGSQAQTLIGEDAASMLLGTEPGTPNPLYPPGTGNTVIAFQDGTSASVFTHNILDLWWGLEATIGLRYLVEEKTGGGFATTTSPSCEAPLVPGGTLPPVPGIDPGRTYNSLRALCGADPYDELYEDDRITGTAALGRLFDNGIYVYGGYANGFKAGGINLNPPSTVGGTFQFKPETIDNYEAGVRFPLFDGALQSRATYFTMDLRDYQINSFDGTAFSVSNAGHVKASGVEFESRLRIGAGLSFNGNYTFTDAKYAEGTAPIGTGGSDVVGKRLTNSPEHVAQLSATYRTPLPFWGMSFHSTLSGRYQSQVNTGVDLNPGKDQESYTLLNGRVGVKFPGDYELAVAGTNLTDVYYHQIIFDSVIRPRAGTAAEPRSFNGYPGNPRTVVVELTKRF